MNKIENRKGLDDYQQDIDFQYTLDELIIHILGQWWCDLV